MSVLWKIHCEDHDVDGPQIRISAESDRATLRAYDIRYEGEHDWADFLREHEWCPKTLDHE